MSFGSTAYASFVRIHFESGEATFPSWEALSHVGRMAWEGAAQAVALSVLPKSFSSDPDETDDDDGLDDVDLDEADAINDGFVNSVSS